MTRLLRACWPLAVAGLTVAGCGSGATPIAPTMAPAASTADPAAPPPAPAPPAPAPAPTSVRYRVTFDALWSQQTHPQDYPGNPHFSPLIGGTHNAAVSFWRDGGIASDGLKRMAEQGFTSPLDSHVNDAIAAGTARTLVRGAAVALSPASVAVEFEMHQSHPLLTLVTMVAPSPDWFVGVSGLALFSQGQWIERVAIDLPPWDAGTDGGRSYESSDAPLSPRQPIARLTGFPVATNGEVRPMGRFVMERLP